MIYFCCFVCCMLSILLQICVCDIAQTPIICRFCLFFCFLFDFNLVLVVFIAFVFYIAKISLKISRVFFFCYLVIFNIKKFAFLINSVLLCVVIVVIWCFYGCVCFSRITILQLSLL